MPTYNCNNYNCDDNLGTHTPNDCNDISLGGYADLLLLECDHAITDPGNATQVETALADDTAHLILNVKSSLPAPSAIKQSSLVANQPDIVTGYELSGTLVDGSVSSANSTFYNNVGGGRSFGGLIFHNKEEGKVYWHNAAVRFEGGLVMPENDSEAERYEYSFNLKKDPNDANPTISVEPAGIFD